jgi:uncharacterized membrane protein YedE/YeeE
VAIIDALAGGVLIGTGASLLLVLNGRVAGISSIAGTLPFSRGEEQAWRLFFLLGLIVGVAAVYDLSSAAATPVIRTGFPPALLAVAGVLVGYGTALGNGCTSGHGVCGLGRLSLRSLAATVVFLVTGIATTYLVRHVFGVF